jgi:hypothetical protein
MASKKQIADMENTIVLLEEKMERLEEEHATMKQMISMQNALIDNLQMMVKMLTLQGGTPTKHQTIHIGGRQEDDRTDNQVDTQDNQEVEKKDKGDRRDLQQSNSTTRISYAKHRMARVV